MNWTRNVGCLIFCLAALTAVVPAFAQDALLLGYEGPDRVQRAIAAAQKEGSFTLYTSFAEKDLPPLVGAFEKRYGIKVRVWRSHSEKVLQRTLNEAAGRRYEVDVVHTSALEMEALHREKILQRVAPPHAAELLPGALRPHREWTATYLSIWVQAYNTNLVRKEELPKSFAELLEPKWKGRLGMEAAVSEWYASIVMDMGEERGVRFFRELVARNGISMRSGHTLLNNLVIAGDVALALTMYQYMPEAAKRKGAPVDWFVLEPAVARMSGLGIARRAPHPNAALLFYEFMLSAEARQLMLSMDYIPTTGKLPAALADRRLTLVDPALALDQRDKWLKSFEDVLIRRNSGSGS